MHAFCRRLVTDPEYRTNFEAAVAHWNTAPMLEHMVWHYAIGRPQESLEMTSSDISLAQIIAGGVPQDDEDESEGAQPPV